MPSTSVRILAALCLPLQMAPLMSSCAHAAVGTSSQQAKALPPATGYPHGIRPSAPQVAQNRALLDYWTTWKARYVRRGACGHDRAYIDSSVDAGEPGSITVSEAHGWGMLMAAMMGPLDPSARPLFDDMVRFLDDHPSTLKSGLMAWDVHAPCTTPVQSTSAPDGDLDIAYALLVAHQQWGSLPGTHYLSRARAVMAALMDTEAVPDHGYFRLWEYIKPGDPHAFETRTSDMMFDHFRAFEKHSGDPRWARMREASFAAIAKIERATPVGIFPDFTKDMETDPKPIANVFRTDGRDGTYSYNACRLPMRWAIDAILHGDPRSQRLAERLTRAIGKAAQFDPKRVLDGYDLDGKVLGTRNRLAFIAPVAVGAMADAKHQQFLDALWSDLTGRPLETEGYYGNALKMLALIALSGRWMSP